MIKKSTIKFLLKLGFVFCFLYDIEFLFLPKDVNVQHKFAQLELGQRRFTPRSPKNTSQGRLRKENFKSGSSLHDLNTLLHRSVSKTLGVVLFNQNNNRLRRYRFPRLADPARSAYDPGRARDNRERHRRRAGPRGRLRPHRRRCPRFSSGGCIHAAKSDPVVQPA